jgi:hypothetical protein
VDTLVLYFRSTRKSDSIHPMNPDDLGAPRRVGGDAMREEDAFEAGYDAYWDDVDPESNPFKPETAEQRAWDEGWSQAQLEDDDGGEEE